MPAAVPFAPFDANVAVRIATVIAGETPSVADWTAATDVSCYLAMDGFGFTQEQASISFDALCSDQTFQLPGRKSAALTLTGIDNTNTPYEDDYNELNDVLTESAQRVVLARYGAPYDSAAAVGQKVYQIPITVGVKTPVTPEANSAIRSAWNTFVSGPAGEVALAA